MVLTVKKLAEMLQDALPKLGPDAPVYMLATADTLSEARVVGGSALFETQVEVQPKGNLGPGSVLLIAAPLAPRDPSV